jgi:hypothetical protein
VPLIPCRATINAAGLEAGSHVIVDPDDPATALYLEKGYLVPDDELVVEGGDGAGGEGDADESLDPDAAVGDDADALLEPVGDGGDELALPAA